VTNEVNRQAPPAYNRAGGVFMFRRNILLGWIMAAFGIGLLFGMWIEGTFISHCIGFALIFAGTCGICRR